MADKGRKVKTSSHSCSIYFPFIKLWMNLNRIAISFLFQHSSALKEKIYVNADGLQYRYKHFNHSAFVSIFEASAYAANECMSKD